MPKKSQFSYVRNYQRAQKLLEDIEAKSAASAKKVTSETYAKTLREMLPSFVHGTLPKGGDVLAFAIRSMAEGIVKYEPGKTVKQVEGELTATASSEALGKELAAIIEDGFQKRFNHVVELSREASAELDSLEEITRLVRNVEASAKEMHLPAKWIRERVKALESDLVAEFRKPETQWKLLKPLLTESDIKHLQRALKASLLEKFFDQAMEVHESIPLTTLKDSEKGRKALGIIYIETLKERLSQLLDMAEQPMEERNLQSQYDRLRASFNVMKKDELEKLSPEERAAYREKLKEHNSRLGQLKNQIKQSSLRNREARQVFAEPSLKLKVRVEQFARMWGEDPKPIWETFAQEMVSRAASWDKRVPRHRREHWKPAFLPLYDSWTKIK
jgi:murein L,D-transpeptidase YcbB/YkuD